MANSLYNNLVNTLRKKQYSISSSTKVLTFGAIYLGSYVNWRQDKQPLIWIQWSDNKYTHGINLHHLNSADRAWFMRTIYLMSKGRQTITPRNMYHLLKMKRINIVKTAYRKYFTSLLNMRLVSPGITNLHSLVYTNHRENFIHILNKQLEPKEISKGAPRIAYTSEDLQTRVSESMNSYNISKKTVSPSTSPITQKAPWLKS
jgi:hypothetical protein